MKIKLTRAQANFLKEQSSQVVLPDNDTWYYFPFWWHPEGKNVFNQVDFDQLPEDVKDAIKEYQDNGYVKPKPSKKLFERYAQIEKILYSSHECIHDPAIKNSENGIFQRYCRKCGIGL